MPEERLHAPIWSPGLLSIGSFPFQAFCRSFGQCHHNISVIVLIGNGTCIALCLPPLELLPSNLFFPFSVALFPLTAATTHDVISPPVHCGTPSTCAVTVGFFFSVRRLFGLGPWVHLYPYASTSIGFAAMWMIITDLPKGAPSGVLRNSSKLTFRNLLANTFGWT